MREFLDRRVLCAIRLRDFVTGSRVDVPLAVKCNNAKVIRNLGGLFVVVAVPNELNIAPYTSAFDLSALGTGESPVPESIKIEGEVSDPSGLYLPRRFTVFVPRDPTVPVPTDPYSKSVFKPVDIDLLPAPSARIHSGWAQLRVTTTVKDEEGKPSKESAFPNVLVRVREATSSSVLGLGMTDGRGEALVIIPDLPLFQVSANPNQPTDTKTSAYVEFIPPMTAGKEGGVVNWSEQDVVSPDKVLPANKRSDPIQLAAGGMVSVSFSVTPHAADAA